MSKLSKKYSPEVRERAVGMVLSGVGEHVSRWSAIVSISGKIGCAPQTLNGRAANASFVLDALEQAIHAQRPEAGGGLVHHSDRGSQYLSKYTERLADAGLEPSVGSVWDSYEFKLVRAVGQMIRGIICKRRTPWQKQ